MGGSKSRSSLDRLVILSSLLMTPPEIGENYYHNVVEPKSGPAVGRYRGKLLEHFDTKVTRGRSRKNNNSDLPAPVDSRRGGQL
jgi:hypothetical protein